MEQPIKQTVELSKDEKLKLLNQKLNNMLLNKNLDMSKVS